MNAEFETDTEAGQWSMPGMMLINVQSAFVCFILEYILQRSWIYSYQILSVREYEARSQLTEVVIDDITQGPYFPFQS